MERLKIYYRRLRDLLIYSDTQIMELALVLVIGLINPTSADRLNHTPLLWTLSGVFLAIYLLVGVLQNSTQKRFWATNLLFAHLVGVLAFEMMGCGIQQGQISYIVQAVVVGYITWKCGKEHAYKCAKKCSRGAKNGK